MSEVLVLLLTLGVVVFNVIHGRRQRERIKELETLLREKLIAELNGSRGRPF